MNSQAQAAPLHNGRGLGVGLTTMKKTYIAPNLQVTRLEHSNAILIVSNPDVGINSQGTVNAANVDVKGSTPSYNVWDDDWSN